MRVFAVVSVIIVAVAAAVLFWMRSRFLGELDRRIATVEQSDPARVDRLEHLPAPVRRHVERSGIQPLHSYAYSQLEQTGQIKLSQDGDWLDFSAQQWFAVDRPAFVWKPHMAMPVGSIVGSDWLDGAQGGLQMRLFGAIPVANADGPEVTEGELARYLAELPWNPAAMATNEQISWTPVDDHHATATLTVGELSSTVTFEFDDAGDIASVMARQRPRGSGADLERLPWGGEFSDYADFDGVRVPSHAEVFWEEDSGRYTYFRGEIVTFELR